MSDSVLRVQKPRVAAAGHGLELRCEIVDTEGEHPFTVRWNAAEAPDDRSIGNALLCFTLIVALRRGMDLHIEAPVSAQLLARARTINQIYHCWNKERFPRTIAVTAQACAADHAIADQGSGSGLFFSGGVDALHTLRCTQHQITHLIYAHGFERTAGDVTPPPLISECLAAAAAETGTRVFEVSSDLRHYTDHFTDFTRDSHASFLAGIGHLLSTQISSVVIASSAAVEALSPLGSHPLVDPLWSSPLLGISHHGCDHDRFEKVAAIADWDLAHKHLRVCARQHPDGRNCGTCEKCLRTMTMIKAVGASGLFSARFAAPFDLEAIRRVEFEAPRMAVEADWRSIQIHLDRRNQTDAEVAILMAVKPKLLSAQRQRLRSRLRPFDRVTIGSSHWGKRWPKFRRKVLRSIEESDPNWLRERVKSNLPALKEEIIEKLLRDDPKWFKRQLRKARWHRLLRKLGFSARPE